MNPDETRERRKQQRLAKYRRNRAAETAKMWERRTVHLAFVAAYKQERGCVRCGFNAHPAALDLHHLDPADKGRSTANHSAVQYNWSLAHIKRELALCVVLCANCHRIEHHRARRLLEGGLL